MLNDDEVRLNCSTWLEIISCLIRLNADDIQVGWETRYFAANLFRTPWKNSSESPKLYGKFDKKPSNVLFTFTDLFTFAQNQTSNCNERKKLILRIIAIGNPSSTDLFVSLQYRRRWSRPPTGDSISTYSRKPHLVNFIVCRPADCVLYAS